MYEDSENEGAAARRPNDPTTIKDSYKNYSKVLNGKGRKILEEELSVNKAVA
jgi:hypothetical protein